MYPEKKRVMMDQWDYTKVVSGDSSLERDDCSLEYNQTQEADQRQPVAIQ